MRSTIELCKEAGYPLMVFEGVTYVSPELERLVAFVRADERNRTWTQEHWTEYERSIAAQERDACAKTKAGKPRKLKPVGRGAFLDEQQFCFDNGWREGSASVRAAIRARGNT